MEIPFRVFSQPDALFHSLEILCKKQFTYQEIGLNSEPRSLCNSCFFPLLKCYVGNRRVLQKTVTRSLCASLLTPCPLSGAKGPQQRWRSCIARTT